MTKLPGYPCTTCGRASESISINLPNKPLAQFCSTKCGAIYMTKTPVKPDERTAAIIGGNAGGAYLDRIGIFDLRNLSAEQWGDFCSAIYAETCAELKRRADDEIPF